MESNLIIYNASAGSGKTFTLVVEYVNLLIDTNIKKNIIDIEKGNKIGNTFNYKNILAVTFTNKATAELKERLIFLLYNLSNNSQEAKSEREKLLNLNDRYTEEIITLSAKQALKNILHDYSNLYIETIDSFFQRILKNMSKELGINPRYNLLIDDKEIIKQAFDIIVEETKDNLSLRKWYFTKINEKIRLGKKWDIEEDILKFSKQLNKEKFKEIEDELFNSIDEKSLEEFKEKLNKWCKEIENNIQDKAKVLLKLIKDNGYNINDFKGGSRGIANGITKLLDNNYDVYFKGNLDKVIDDNKEWFTKPNQLDKNLNFTQDKLNPIVKELNNYMGKNLPQYYSYKTILENIDNLVFLVKISKIKRLILKNKNQFLLSETSNLLSKIIGNDTNSDTSFIFEKIGSQLKYIMIDEFQDTSKLNYNNFKHLLKESYDNNNRSIIVGDVKQSIYRFNNGDWRLLGNLENGLSPESPYLKREPIIENLSVNYRSDKKIIDFNNKIFTNLDKYISNEDGINTEDILKVFKDVEQESKTDKEKGCVRYIELDTEERANKKDLVLEKIIEEINYYRALGFEQKEICILLRTNTEIKQITDYIYKYKEENKDLKYPIDIISDEAFEFSSSKSIDLIISCLKYIEDENDTDSLVKLKLYYQSPKEVFKEDLKSITQNIDRLSFLNNRNELKRKPLIELIPYLINNLDLSDKNSSFIYAFIDALNEYLSQGNTSILSFLNYWEDTLKTKAITISSNLDGIRLMTIHKAKGLEFPVVILPYPNWKLDDAKKTTIWVEAPEGLNEIPYLPIEVKKDLMNSTFSKEYYNELSQVYIDNLNILYVALTRPVNAISIINSYTINKSGKFVFNSGKNVGDLLHYIISSCFELEEMENGGIYVNLGNIKIDRESKKKGFLELNESFDMKIIKSNSEILYSQTKEAEKYVRDLIEGKEESDTNSSRLRGSLLHKVLSEIHTPKDKDKALKELENKGEIVKEEIEEISKLLDYMFREKEEWFDDRNKVLNERSIIFKDGYIKSVRPDRVLLRDGELIIIDYKFSFDKKQIEKYNKQIKEYSQLYIDMGFKKPKSYLWFINQENNRFISDIIELMY